MQNLVFRVCFTATINIFIFTIVKFIWGIIILDNATALSWLLCILSFYRKNKDSQPLTRFAWEHLNGKNKEKILIYTKALAVAWNVERQSSAKPAGIQYLKTYYGHKTHPVYESIWSLVERYHNQIYIEIRQSNMR